MFMIYGIIKIGVCVYAGKIVLYYPLPHLHFESEFFAALDSFRCPRCRLHIITSQQVTPHQEATLSNFRPVFDYLMEVEETKPWWV